MSLSVAAQSLNIQREPSGAIRLSWPEVFAGHALEESSDPASTNAWQRLVRVPEIQDSWRTTLLPSDAASRFYRLGLPLAFVHETSPKAGETEVSVYRESIVRFSLPLADGAQIRNDRFVAVAQGRRILSRVELSHDRRSASLFYLEPLPGNARVVVSFNGADLLDTLGRPLDPDGDGRAGGILAFGFDTLNLTPILGTAVVGRVFAATSEGAWDPDQPAIPLAGVTITVDGQEEALRAVTSADGSFRLEPGPAGRFFVHIDGRTAANSAYPNGTYFPVVGKAWDAVAGVRTNLAGGTGEIFLPRIRGDSLKAASASEPTPVQFPVDVIATNPALAEVRVMVPPNSLFRDDGQRGGRVGIAPVPPNRLPGPLPEGLDLSMVFTVQTDGAGNLDVPAAVCLPNIPAVVAGAPLPPGAKRSLVSFNHKRGQWESVGLMTVAADGKTLCTDPGVGIRQPGWHGAGAAPYTGSDNNGGFNQASGNVGADGGGAGPLGPFPKDSGPATPNGGGPSQRPPSNGGGKGGGTGGSGGGGGNTGGDGSGGGGGGDQQPKPCPEGGLDTCFAAANAEKERCDANKHEALDAYGKECQQLEAAHGKTDPRTKACFASYTALYYQATLTCNELKVAYTKECAGCANTPPALHNDSRTGPIALHAQPAPSPGDRIAWLFETSAELLAPYTQPDAAIPDAILDQVMAQWREADTVAGGNAASFARAESERIEVSGSASFRSFGHRAGNAPAYPLFYRALVWRPTGLASIRGRTEPFGAYQLFVPADATLLHVDFLDPRTRQSATVFPYESPERQYTLPPIQLASSDPQAVDADQDGLTDFAEEILGTHRLLPDTDGDGVPDGIELDQGANPLDGIAVQTGVVSAVDTPGRAADIAIAGDLAVVADGESGVALFSISNPSRPVLLSRVDTAGDARRVAISARHVAVADGAAGLALIDVAAELPWGVRQKIPLGSAARAVAAAGPTVYVGLDSRDVVALDLFTGTQIDRIRIPGSGDLQDLLVAHNVLYVLTSGELFTLPLDSPNLRLEGRVPAPGLLPGGFRPRRLSQADGRLYAGHRRGFTPFELTDPLHPSPQTDVVTPQFGWKHWLPMAPGFAVAVVGPDSTPANNHDLQLYGWDATNTVPTFLSTFPTPGIAQAVAFSKGFAFVADDAFGLQVINVVSSQVGGPPPTITLTSPASEIPSSIVETHVFPVSAQAASAQGLVRSVEYYLDDQLVAQAGHHPFQAQVLAPARTVQKTTFRLRARAIDSAGRSSWSEERSFTLLPDLTPPEVDFEVPGPDRFMGPMADLVVGIKFRERMEARTFTTASLKVYATTGAGTPANTALPATVGYREDTYTAWIAINQPLTTGTYRVEVDTTITDAAGNPLANAVSWPFHIVSKDLRPGGSLTLSGAIERPGAQDQLVFQAEAGQTLYFDEITGACNSGLRWSCLAPDGSVLFDETLGGLGCGSDVGPKVLPTNGVYTLFIEGEPGATNTWQIGIHDIPAPSSFTIAIGDQVADGHPGPGAGQIETPGSKDIYRFQAVAGSEVFFSEPGASCISRFRWRCRAPDATLLFDETLGGEGCGQNAGRRTLPFTGEYLLEVYGDSDATGPYALELWDANPQTFTVGPSAIVRENQPGPGAGRLEHPGSQDLYHLEAPAGTRLRFSHLNVGPGMADVDWSLVDSTGKVLFKTCLACPDPAVVTLDGLPPFLLRVGSGESPVTGTYEIQWGPAP